MIEKGYFIFYFRLLVVHLHNESIDIYNRYFVCTVICVSIDTFCDATNYHKIYSLKISIVISIVYIALNNLH